MDKYNIKGRIFPTVLTVVLPAIVLNSFFLVPELKKFIGDNLATNIIGNIALPSILVFYLSQYVRTLGKEVFQRFYFKGEINMPTTNFMMYANSEYTDDYKTLFREKIRQDFNIILPDKLAEEVNVLEARKKIVEVMSKVRKKLHENEFLLKHNIEYGAIRNSIGGSLLGIVFCIGNLILFKYFYTNQIAFNISIGLLSFYVLLLLLSRFFINSYGNSYAKILFREYLD
ncbi:MAG: hypothetical protein SF052_02895 [Bacteroidia bacterium]|nr:hypothetical protein [Bacteroidia bacterium]